MIPDNHDSLHLYVDAQGTSKSANEIVLVEGLAQGPAEQEGSRDNS